MSPDGSVVCFAALAGGLLPVMQGRPAVQLIDSSGVTVQRVSLAKSAAACQISCKG